MHLESKIDTKLRTHQGEIIKIYASAIVDDLDLS